MDDKMNPGNQSVYQLVIRQELTRKGDSERERFTTTSYM